MAAVLGLSCGYHDAAAALVVNGEVVAAMQEERFTRVRHDASMPLHAARACLRRAGLNAGDLDAAVFYENPYARFERVLGWAARSFPRSLPSIGRVLARQVGDTLPLLDRLSTALAVPRALMEFVEHHKAHAASAWYASGFERGAVLTVDGVGDDRCTELWVGDGPSLSSVRSAPFPHSLGLLYAAVTAWLGFPVNDGEYRVMGLAAFGVPRFREAFAPFVRVGPMGVELDPAPFAHFNDPDLAFGPGLEALLGPRRPRRPWVLPGGEDQRYADVAATLQAITEEAVLALAAEARRHTDAPGLTLAGGVALNAVANARLQAEGPFRELYVQPAAGDAGGALGAAWLGAVARGDRPVPPKTAALGEEPGPVADVARALGLRVDTVDPDAEAAERVARGEVVAWVQGRFEWGPRALGNRSLLADARSPIARDRLNTLVKRREPFRPFAPAIREADFSAFVQGPADALTACMTTVRRVVDPGLPAVTHVDGTARAQSVPPEGALGGVVARLGVVLNTSLNAGGEPICGSARDALSFFGRHPVDALIVGDTRITRP